jgi:uncharacterized Zn-finger protein
VSEAEQRPSGGQILVGAADLEGPGVIFCPNPRMPLWSNHPRVFLDILTTGQAKCPYCGAEYRLQAGVKPHAAH